MIEKPDGSLAIQDTYRVTQAVTSAHWLELREVDCSAWDQFATEMRAQPSWTAPWFSTTRRFFLYGGGKELNPELGDVDRLVDYSIAIEAALVWERDFVSRRFRERAARIASGSRGASEVKALMKLLYELRSTIVHGSVLSAEQKRELEERRNNLEEVVRDVITGALRALPVTEEARSSALTALWDIGVEDQIQYLTELFRRLPVSERPRFLQRVTHTGSENSPN